MSMHQDVSAQDFCASDQLSNLGPFLTYNG